jgi:hypothetical protein
MKTMNTQAKVALDQMVRHLKLALEHHGTFSQEVVFPSQYVPDAHIEQINIIIKHIRELE